MSTFAVFGMTKSRAREEAKKLVDSYSAPKRRQKTLDEIRAEIDEKTGVVFEARSVRLSDMFDAPQFAEEFLAAAKKEESRGLHIRAHVFTGEKDPKTKRPLKKWVDYPSPEYAHIESRVSSGALV
jgi:aspartate oxidase